METSIGLKIKTLREQHNLSQEQLAEVLGVSRQLVSKWERGAGMPTVDMIVGISKLFEVTTDYILRQDE